MTDIPGGVEVYDRILNDFYNEVEGLSSLKPYMVGPGNHGTYPLNQRSTNELTCCFRGKLRQRLREEWLNDL